MKNIFLLLLLCVLTLPAVAADSTVVNNGACETINEHGECRGVTNNAGGNIFVPTKSASEWTSFRDNAPTGVNVQNCVELGSFTGSGFTANSECTGTILGTLPGDITANQCATYCNASTSTECCMNIRPAPFLGGGGCSRHTGTNSANSSSLVLSQLRPPNSGCPNGG